MKKAVLRYIEDFPACAPSFVPASQFTKAGVRNGNDRAARAPSATQWPHVVSAHRGHGKCRRTQQNSDGSSSGTE